MDPFEMDWANFCQEASYSARVRAAWALHFVGLGASRNLIFAVCFTSNDPM